MFDFTEAKIAAMAIHRVGSTVRENELVLANELVHISDSDLLELLKNFFVSPFKQPEFYSFSHNADVEENLVYNFSSNLFSSQENLLEQSRNIANHLYRCSTHPNIKDGELYVILMSDCVIEGELVDAVGIFKSETKDTWAWRPKDKDFRTLPMTAGMAVMLNRLILVLPDKQIYPMLSAERFR